MRFTAEGLRQRIAVEDDPLERLRCFVVEYYRLCRPTTDGDAETEARPPVMAEFAQQLLTSHPKEAAQAFAPLVALFEEVLQAATAAGAVRPGLRHGPIVGVVLEAIMFNSFSSTIGGVSVRADETNAADELWDLILHGIGTGPA